MSIQPSETLLSPNLKISSLRSLREECYDCTRCVLCRSVPPPILRNGVEYPRCLPSLLAAAGKRPNAAPVLTLIVASDDVTAVARATYSFNMRFVIERQYNFA